MSIMLHPLKEPPKYEDALDDEL
ncbi:hypothetical protein C5167_030784 [Papaver somniferum]|nr:hypothetical protein C5167_030784 [Papaver somniferum]